MRRFALVLLGCLVLASLPLVAVTQTSPRAEALSSQPNIVLVVTDDQTMDVMSALPEIDGSWKTFDNAFINSPLCCPSRASILTGQFAHHTLVERNSQADDLEDKQTLATWLQAAGYRTGIFGKYLNNYPWDKLGPGNPPTPYRPPGWNKVAIFGSVPEYLPAQEEAEPAECPNLALGYGPNCYVLNESIGAATSQDSMLRRRVYDGNTTITEDPATGWPDAIDTNGDYSTDVLAELAKRFISNASGAPFFLYFAPVAPHWPFWPSPAHDESVHSAQEIDDQTNDVEHLGDRLNFNRDIDPNGPWWQVNRCQTSTPPHSNGQCPLDVSAFTGSYVPAAGCPAPSEQEHHSPSVQEQQCQHYNAWRTLKSVNDALTTMRVAAENHPSQVNKWDNTIVIFMTDNGLSMMSHNWHAKTCIYEECIRTPLRIRYPGSTGTVSSLVSNIDIAPTIVDIAEGAFDFKRPQIRAAMEATNPDFGGFDGRSLLPFLQGSDPPDWRKALLVQSKGWTTGKCFDPPPFYGVRSTHWVYGEFDPGACTTNLGQDPPPGTIPDGARDTFKELYGLSEPCPGGPIPHVCVLPEPEQMKNRASVDPYAAPITVGKQRQQKLVECLSFLRIRDDVLWPDAPEEVGAQGQCEFGF